MPTRTFTNGGVDNLWSTAGNWDTPPVDNDTVVIAAGQTCEYDIDNSSAIVWPNGINGLTITGTLKISRVTSSYLKMKAATTITGAGTFNVGESAALAIPFAVKCTITGGASWYINGAAGLTMTVYAAEPAINTVYLTALEPIGETVIAVDTSVVADIWAAGDLIHINDINQAAESEERTIAAGGIAAGAITITVGLTAAKSSGALMHLISRNVKIIGVGAAGYAIYGFTANKLTIAGGEWKSAAYRCLGVCTSCNISGGSFSGGGSGIYNAQTASISGGVFSGFTNAIISNTRITISGGIFSGNGYVINASQGTTITGGVFKGNNSVVYNFTGVSITGGTFSNNFANVHAIAGVTIYGGTFSNTTNNVYLSSGVTKYATFSGNTRDISVAVLTMFFIKFSGTIDNYQYETITRESYTESLDHDQVQGAFKAWTRGGVTASQAVTKPTGWTKAMQTTFENAAVEGYWQKEVTVGSLASVNIEMHLRKDAAMGYLPRCIIFNKAASDPFAGGAGISTFTMTNSVDTWETSTYTYYNSTAEDVTLVVRFQGMNAANNMFSGLKITQINVDLTTTLANIAIVDGIVDDILVDTDVTIPGLIAAIDTDVLAATVEGAYSVQDVLKFMAGVLAGKSSGGATGTITFRDLTDTLDRVVAAVDADGNRLAVTLDNS